MVVNKKIGNLVLGILAFALLVHSQAEQTICSTFCGTNGCNGWSMADCNGNCYSGWDPISGLCDFTTASRRQIMAYSDDAGGEISLVTDPMSSTCSFNSGVTYYGDFLAGTTYGVVLSSGTYIAHYAFDVYVNVILVDIDSSAQWKGNPKMFATLTSTSQTVQTSLSTNNGGSNDQSVPSGNVITTSSDKCLPTNKVERYERLVFPNFYHNTTGDSITVEFRSDNSDAIAVWNARQFIFVARLCNIYCLACFNDTINDCYQCDVAAGYMLSNTTCATSCLTGYGNTSDPGVCVLCDILCIVCYEVGDNCSSCNQTSPSRAYLFDNTTVGYTQCVNPCPDGYFANTTSRACELCDGNCTECNFNSTYCYACQSGFSWYNYKCLSPCITGLYQFYDNSTNTSNCSQCPNVCLSCDNYTVCTACTLSGPNQAYLLNNTCYTNCPAGYFQDDNGGAGPNLCIGCATQCATCTGNPTPCQSCNTGFYLYNDACSTTCPTGYFAYDPWWRCLDCPTYCVDLTISMTFSDSTNKKMYIDMQFSRDLNFSTFDYQNFQSLSITNQAISNFNIYYLITSSSSYRITLEPKGYIFIYNETVTVTTMEQPTTLHYSRDNMPFKTTNYQKTADKNWFLMNSPSMTDIEQSITNGLSGFNDAFANATAVPFIAEVKKAGVFALLFSGAHITSATVMVNSVPPQNMYEGVRFWACSVFYDVPGWQQTSSLPNHFFTSEMHNLTLNQRRLFDLNSLYWRFQRTGMTTFFIYDVYIPLLLISVVWFLALLAKILKNCQGYNFKSYEARYFTVLHKLHELVIIYVTFAMMLEWIYFDAASTERWISLLICLAFTCYFVGYHLYVYYDMISYPEAMIGNDKYEYYVRRYSTFLKNLRYEEYDMKEGWSPKHFFRPYNYHILSYYKKFCMIISLPLFYDSKNWQAGVLVILQGLELARFLLTKPYYATWRNVFRFCLELALLLFFMVVFILGFILEEIIKNDPNTLEKYIKVYYNLGWLGFALVWTFNLGFIVLMIVDIAQGCKKNNRQLMDEARRVYYYNKITEYEKDSDQVPLGLMNKWVKLGNLNDRDHQQLPNINVRIEYYKLIKHGDYYDVDLLKIVELFMNTDFNYHQENNTTPGKKIKKRIKLSKEVSSSLYAIVNELYSKHAKKGTEAIVIKTFINVEQRDFKAGDRIPLLPEHMLQKIQIQNFQGEKESIKLSKLIKGFPINAFDLQSI